jgi:glucokinase
MAIGRLKPPALHCKAREQGFASLEEMFAFARSGDGRARGFVARAADDLALGLISVIHLFSPERLVIGGGVSAAFDLLEPLLSDRLDGLLLPAFRGITLRKAELCDDSGLLGAALLATRSDLRG